jgi:hypothetical protein
MTQEAFEAEVIRLTESIYRMSFALLPRKYFLPPSAACGRHLPPRGRLLERLPPGGGLRRRRLGEVVK